MLRIAIAFFAAFLFAAPADASRRVALVIGNSAYAHAPELPNPKNDAVDMAAKLSGLGFAVVSGVDLDLAGVRAKVREFSAAATSADLALFFYAGHGIQANGVNYMIPVDADIADEAALDFEAVEMESVLKVMADAPTLVVLLDACRDNPFGEKLARSLRRGGRTRNIALGKGLAQLDAGTGTLVAFSTQPGNVALDGEGRNSPFTAGLLKHLGQPGMSITDELILVRNAVLGATGNRQRPWDSSSLTGRVVLNAAVETPAVATGKPAFGIEADFDFARSLDTADAWAVFLDRHGGSGDMRVALARTKLRRLTAEPADGIPEQNDRSDKLAAVSPRQPESRSEPGSRGKRECDRLADVPFHKIGTVDLGSAEAACRAAIADHPGDGAAVFLLGRVLDGAGRESEALAQYRKAVELGNAGAMNNLGWMYENGQGGLAKDEAEAAKWYRKAADLGHARAMNNLGVMYKNGDGALEKDEAEAVKLYRKAAELGDEFAMTNLGWMYENGWGGLAKDETEAVKWYRKAVGIGHAGAMNNLGVMYAIGHGGLAKDEAEAAKWYRKAADLGHARAMNNLGVMYKNGRGGLAMDEAEAAKWYRKAADHGNSNGMSNLGWMYENGRGGVSKDGAQAARLYLSALKIDPSRQDYLSKEFSGFSSEVRQTLQTELRDVELYDGPIDGKFGPKMKAALKAYATAN